ncbi:Holliday junction DNA helicase RuvA, partial [hydrothermal vent metagenome]
MITKIKGQLNSLTTVAALIEVGAFEYEVYIPEFVRRQLQSQVGEIISLRTIEFIEG